jgi:hypothetical protein
MRHKIMTLSVMKNKLMNEINLLPEDKLGEVYNFVHYFRLGTEKNKQDSGNLLSFSGAWSDMSNEVFDDYLSNITERRSKAFSGRRSNETSTY